MSAPITGYIDLVESGPGFLHLSGWIIRAPGIPDDAIISLVVDNQFFAYLTDFFIRSDLIDRTDRPAGFSVIGPKIVLTEKSKVSFVHGNMNISVNLPLHRPTFRPRLAVDVAGPDVISGWIFYPEVDLCDLRVKILNQHYEITIGSIRPDVPFGTGDHQKARSFSCTLAEFTPEFTLSPETEKDNETHVKFSICQGEVELYEGLFEYGSDIEADISSLINGHQRRYLKLLITDRFYSDEHGYSITNGKVNIHVQSEYDGESSQTKTFSLVLPPWQAGEVWTARNVRTNRSVEIRLHEPNSCNQSDLFIDITNINGCITGSVLDLASETTSTEVQLLCFGCEPLVQPLLAGPHNAKFWGINGPVPHRVQMTERQLLERLRGINPNITISEEAPRTIEFLNREGVAASVVPLSSFGPADGRLEIVQHDRISGWAASREVPEALQLVDVYLDDIRFHTAVAANARQDLVDRGISTRGGGFKVKPTNPTMSKNVKVAVFPALTMAPLSQSGSALVDLPSAIHKVSIFRYMKPSDFREINVTIIVPIYNAFEDVDRCLSSVIPSLRSGINLILIDDASSDERIGVLLDSVAGLPFVKVFRNSENIGFTRTVNRGILEARDSDVILLNSDTVVPDGWVEGLMVAAYSDDRIATATPMSNNAGVFSVPEPNVENALPWGLSVNECSRLFRQGSMATYPRIPTGNGFCMYIRREALDAVGLLDEVAFPIGYGEENDLCMRALRAGFEHVLDDRTYVYHRRSASFGALKDGHYAAGREALRSRYPEYKQLITAFDGDALNAVRWRCRKSINNYHPSSGPTKKRLLFVISTDTGGTPQTNIDLMSNLPEIFECYILKCDTIKLQFFRFHSGDNELIESFDLRDIINPSLHMTREYTTLVSSLIIRHAIDLVHIRHLGWHGADLPIIAHALRLPVVFSLHDFYTVCPTVKLLDENNVYCGGKCTPTNGECQPELWKGNEMPFLKNQFVNRWREIFRPALECADALITTSPFARDVIVSNFPSLDKRAFHVIPHGRTFEENVINCVPPSNSEPLRVLIAGSISAAKGSKLIVEMAALDKLGDVHFHILGDPGILKSGPNITVHGRYRRSEFNALSKQIRPHIGAVLSIWPETYCHTLTELWAAGIPVLGIDIGAVGERIKAHRGGWLLPLGSTPSEIFAAFLSIKKDSTDHRARLAEVIDWQFDYSSRYTAAEMALRYNDLYVSLLLKDQRGDAVRP